MPLRERDGSARDEERCLCKGCLCKRERDSCRGICPCKRERERERREREREKCLCKGENDSCRDIERERDSLHEASLAEANMPLAESLSLSPCLCKSLCNRLSCTREASARRLLHRVSRARARALSLSISFSARYLLQRVSAILQRPLQERGLCKREASARGRPLQERGPCKREASVRERPLQERVLCKMPFAQSLSLSLSLSARCLLQRVSAMLQRPLQERVSAESLCKRLSFRPLQETSL